MKFTTPVEELEYLEKLLTLEQVEDLAEYQNQVLETPLKERQRKGTSWYPVRVKNTQIGTGGKFVLELERNVEFNQPHQFQAGVQAALFWNAPAGQKTQQLPGTVLSVDQSVMRLQIMEDDLPDWVDERQIGVDVLFDENSYREMKSALEKVKNAKPGSRLERIRQVALGWEQAEFQEAGKFDTSKWPIQHLNESQQKAVLEMMAAKDVFVIHGPPGTGKTTTLVAAIKTALLYMPQVLVCAPSNAAADLLTEKLAEAKVKVLRVGNPARISDEILSYTLDYQISNTGDAKEIKRLRKLAHELKSMAYKYKKYYDRSDREQKQLMIKEAKSILSQIANMEKYVVDGAKETTQAFVTTLVGSAAHILRGKHFEMVLIDEAGQALEPACWIPIAKADKVVFAGDHCQLPPTVKSKEAARSGLETTLMEKVLDRQTREVIAMLQVQYRMNEEIMGFSSTYFYEGKLKADSSVSGWKVGDGHRMDFNPAETLESDNRPVTFIDTAGTGYEEKFHPESTGLSNPEEARMLIGHLSEWLERSQKQLTEHAFAGLSIALISPYREQVELLKRLVSEMNSSLKPLKVIRVGTVDGFQGQESDVVYISLVRSNSKHEIGFLRDIRRTNVAITRARKRLVIIGDSATLSHSKFYGELLQYIQNLNSYQSAWEFIA